MPTNIHVQVLYTMCRQCFPLLIVCLSTLVSCCSAGFEAVVCETKHWQPNTQVTILQAGTERARPLEIVLGSVPNKGPIRELSSVYYQLYAQNHGYKYARIVLADYLQAAGKPAAIYHYLQQSDLVVFVDFTVVIPMDSSILCLLEKWGFLPNSPATVLVPRSLMGVNSTSSGFMVWRKSELGNAALGAWHTAMQQAGAQQPTGHRPHDEEVWLSQVQQHFRPGELVVAPCDEANGYAELYTLVGAGLQGLSIEDGPRGCAGKHVARVTRRLDVHVLYKYFIHALALQQGKRILQPGTVEILTEVPEVPLLQYDQAAFATNAALPYPKLLPPWP